MIRSSKPEWKPIEHYDPKGRERCNNPPVGLITHETYSDSGKKTYPYDLHLDPTPVWGGKAKHTSFEISTFSLHVHELMQINLSQQRTQSSAIPVTMYEKAAASRLRTRMTRIARIFTDMCVSVSSLQSVFHSVPSAFITAETLQVLDSAPTYAPQGIRVHALQRRDSGRFYLRLIFVSLNDRIKEIQLKLFPIINENGFVYSGGIRAHPRHPRNPCSIGGTQ